MQQRSYYSIKDGMRDKLNALLEKVDYYRKNMPTDEEFASLKQLHNPPEDLLTTQTAYDKALADCEKEAKEADRHILVFGHHCVTGYPAIQNGFAEMQRKINQLRAVRTKLSAIEHQKHSDELWRKIQAEYDENYKQLSNSTATLFAATPNVTDNSRRHGSESEIELKKLAPSP